MKQKIARAIWLISSLHPFLKALLFNTSPRSEHIYTVSHCIQRLVYILNACKYEKFIRGIILFREIICLFFLDFSLNLHYSCVKIKKQNHMLETNFNMSILKLSQEHVATGFDFNNVHNKNLLIHALRDKCVYFYFMFWGVNAYLWYVYIHFYFMFWGVQISQKFMKRTKSMFNIWRYVSTCHIPHC